MTTHKAERSIKAPNKVFSVISFFAGCGGMDFGFVGGFSYKKINFPALPFRVVRAYDNDEKCVVTYSKNIGDHIENRDLSKVDIQGMPKADVLIGGFPCQDFSSCGPKAGLTSKRGRLYRTLIEYMKKYRPMVVVGENVPNLARMMEGKVLETILDDFRKTGYRFELWDLFAPDYGVPQRRRRLFFVGVREDIHGMPKRPVITHESKHRSIDWAIGDLINICDESIPNQSQYFLASKAKKGNGQGDESNREGEPAYTIRANAKSRVQYHYSAKRRLTVRECARVQTFPDSFIFPHSTTTNIMQIGNAVPPMLAHQVARSVGEFLGSI